MRRPLLVHKDLEGLKGSRFMKRFHNKPDPEFSSERPQKSLVSRAVGCPIYPKFQRS
jgi:hypothetical protein